MTEREYERKLYRIAKRENRCVQCGQQDAFTLVGRARCSICAEKARETDKKRDKEVRCKEGKELRMRRAENGLCVRCGKKAPEGRKTCRKCVSQTNKRQRERRIEQGMNWPRGDNGICWICNKNSVMQDRKLCEVCYEKSLYAVQRANEERLKNGSAVVKQSIAAFWTLERSKSWKNSRNQKNV